MAENKKTSESYDASEQKKLSDVSDRLKSTEATERKRVADAERKRLADEKQARIAAEQKQAELEYAENYRRKLLKDQKRRETQRKAAELEAKERAEAMASEARARAINEILERERAEAVARSERATALLNRVTKSLVRDDEGNSKREEAVEKVTAPVTEEAALSAESAERVTEEVTAEPVSDSTEQASELGESESCAEEALADTVKAQVPESAKITDDGEKMILNISDDRFLLNISPDGAVMTNAGPAVPPTVSTFKPYPDAEMRPVTPAEVLERDGTALSVKTNITVATEDGEAVVEDDNVVSRAVVKGGAQSLSGSTPEVVEIKRLGRYARTKSDFNKYLSESNKAIKRYNKLITASDEALQIENINLSNTAAVLVDAIKAKGAVIEIRSDNLRSSVRFNQKSRVKELSSLLAQDITEYNDRVAAYATYTGEQLTRISPTLPERLVNGTGIEVIPALSYKESFTFFNEDTPESSGSTYVLNLPANPGEAPTVISSDGARSAINNGTSRISPVYPAITAEELLLGAHAYNTETYKEYLKVARKATKELDSVISKLRNKATQGQDLDADTLTQIIATERERLIIMFNTLAASVSTSSNRLIAEAKRALIEAMARYNSLSGECKSVLDVELAPVKASMADDVLAGKTKVDIPRIARLTELVEKVGDEERIVGKRPAENKGASCTIVINAKGASPEVKEGKKKRPGGIRTVIGHFFIGGTARRGDGSDDSELASLVGAAAIGAGAALSTPTASGISPEAIATAAVTGSVIASAMTDSQNNAPTAENDTDETVDGAPVVAAQALKNAEDAENENETLHNKPPVMPEELAESRPVSSVKRTGEREPVVVSAEDMAKAEAARAERERIMAERESEAAVQEPETIPDAEPTVQDEPEIANVQPAPAAEVVSEPVSESSATASAENVPEPSAEPESASRKTTPRRYIPEPEREREYIPRESAPAPVSEAEELPAEEEISTNEELPEAPINDAPEDSVRRVTRREGDEEVTVTEPVTEELIDDGAEDYVPEVEADGEDAPDANASLNSNDLQDSAEPSITDTPVAAGLTDGSAEDEEPKKKKIRLVQKAPPKKDGEESSEVNGEQPAQEGTAPVYPGNVINKSEYVDEDDYNPDDISNLPPVIEIDDASEEIENDVLVKPTKAGLKKHLRYVGKKIKKLKRERERALRKKSWAKSIVPKVKALIDALGVQKKIIDWYCNAMSSCCDVNDIRKAKSVGRRLKREIRIYNKFVREYERLTDDRLTRASLDIPKDILDGEDYQTLPKVTFRSAEGPEEGTVYSDGVTETADYVSEYSNDVVMNQRDLNKLLSKSDREIAGYKRELDDKVKEKHGAWGVEKTLLMVDCLGLQKKIIDTLASDLRAACQVSALKKMQSVKKNLAYEIKQYNKLVDEYKATSGNKLTRASESIPKDIILGNLYTPIPIVGCIYGRGSDDELNGEITAMSRNVYGVEDDDESTVARAAFRSQVASQANKDLTMITKRADYETTMLESERDMLTYRFGKDPMEVRATKRRIAKRLEEIRRTHKLALKYENNDNRRYYAVVTSNPKTMSVKRQRVDRTRIALLRSKIIKLLNERDIVNGKLMALYSGIGMNLDGTSKNQTLRRVKNAAAQKSKKKQRALAKFVKNLPISMGEKTRFYNLMNSKVDAESTLALTKHRLRREKLHSEDKLCAKQDIRDLKAKIRALNKEITNLINNVQGRVAVAEAGSSWYFAFVVVLLCIIGLAVAAFAFFGNQISAFLGQ